MKNFFLLGFISLVCISSVHARETLVPDLSVVIDTGTITEPALLASPGGEVFIEFSTATKFVHEEGLISFNGEILPPAIIELPDQRPKLRMNPLVSFELMSDSGEPLLFIDRFDAQNARNILRDNYLNPETIARSAWVKLIVPIEDPAVGRPQLWEYIGPDDGWAVIGGITDEPSPEGVRIFSAILRRTGVYTVFDEDPAPKHPEDEVDTSLEYDEYSDSMGDEAFWNESNGELPEGMTWEDMQAITSSDPNAAPGEYPAISGEIPSVMADEKTTLEVQKDELLAELAQTQDPAKFRLTQELIDLLEQKIDILGQRETLLYQKDAVQASAANAMSEEERTALLSQLVMIDRQLGTLDETALDAQIQEAETVLAQEGTLPTADTPPVSEPKIDIPNDGKLPQTGVESMNKGESFSLVFPIALFVVLFLVITSSIVAARKSSH